MWVLLLAQSAAACTQSGQFDEAAFTASLYAGSLGGVSLGLLLLVLASLPLCCGVLKEHSKAISTITISLGILTLVVPLLGSLSACGPFVQSVCSDRCPGFECSVQEKEDISQVCHALGFFVVYISAFGWVSCIVGVIAASLGCCVCCQCCRPMPKDLEPRPRVTPRSVASVAPIALPVGSRGGPVGPVGGPVVGPVGGPVAPGSPVPMERLELGERMDLGDLKDPKFMPVPPSVPMMVVGTPSPKQADA